MVEAISHYAICRVPTNRFPLLTTRNHIPHLRPVDIFISSGVSYVTNTVALFQRTIDDILKVEGIKNTFAYIDNVTVCRYTKADHDRIHDRFLTGAKKYDITFNADKTVAAVGKIQLLGYLI